MNGNAIQEGSRIDSSYFNGLPFRNKIKDFGEEEHNEWMKSVLIFDPKSIDPPHVNSMKRATSTSTDGEFVKLLY